MSSRIGIFVATMTGTAEMCAEEIGAALGGQSIACEMRLMDGQSVDALDDYDRVVIVSSTYGHGDIPDNGQAFFESIKHADSLAGIRYAVFGLGDMTYATTFCEAGQKWGRAARRQRRRALRADDAARCRERHAGRGTSRAPGRPAGRPNSGRRLEMVDVPPRFVELIASVTGADARPSAQIRARRHPQLRVPA